MSSDIHALPETRSWREIPQQVRPRAMSGEGRRRVVMDALKATLGTFALCLVAWGAWAVVSSINPGDDPSTTAKADRVRSLVLVTDGVLDKNWLAGRLSLPSDATLMGLDLGMLRSRVLADPQVASATLVRNFPDTLTVRISERSPVVRMMLKDGSGEPRAMLISRDGIVFSGTGFDPAMVQTLPWIDGVNLKRTGGSFEPVDGMREVSDLLSCAKFEAEGLYRNWQVVNLSKLGSDDEIEVRTRDGMRVTFGTKEGYLRQVARLDLLVGESTDPTRPIREVNLALGSQVPVAYGTAAPSLEGPPVNAAGPAASRAMIAFPSFTTSSQDTTHREL